MKTIRKFLVLILVTAILSTGCATIKDSLSGVKKETPEYLRVKPLVADELLKERIDELSSRIEEYNALDKEIKKEGKDDSKALADLQQSLRHAEYLLKTYRAIEKSQKKLLGHKSYSRERKIYRKMIEELFQGLTRLEEGYFKDRNKTLFAKEQFLKGYESEIREIEEYCMNKDHPNLIESYKRIKERYGEYPIPLNIKLCYAEALSHTDQVKEAIEVAEGLMDGESLDSIDIQSNLIDWYLKVKDPEKALENFERLSSELDRKMDMFLASRKKVLSPMYGESEKPIKGLLVDDIVEEDIEPIGDKGKEVDIWEGTQEDMVEEDSSGEIKEEIQESLHERLKRANDIIDKERLEDAVKKTEEKERFLLAKRLIESGKEEEAIKELNKLRDGERYGQESREMIRRSIDEFARKKREEAAKLFFMAKKKTDPLEKKGLLLRSFELLKEVIKKYPTCSYSGKIVKNIEVVKEEILKIDPQSSQNDPNLDE